MCHVDVSRLYGGQDWTALCLVRAVQRHIGQVVLDNFYSIFKVFLTPRNEFNLQNSWPTAAFRRFRFNSRNSEN